MLRTTKFSLLRELCSLQYKDMKNALKNYITFWLLSVVGKNMQPAKETEEYEDVEMSFEKRQLLIRPPIFSTTCYVS